MLWGIQAGDCSDSTLQRIERHVLPVGCYVVGSLWWSGVLQQREVMVVLRWHLVNTETADVNKRRAKLYSKTHMRHSFGSTFGNGEA